VIARIWKAQATSDRAADYVEHFKAAVAPELRAIRGFEGATILRRALADHVELSVITWWASREAIRAFAGDAVETAVVDDTAARMLIAFDREVEHHGVAFNEPAPRGESQR